MKLLALGVSGFSTGDSDQNSNTWTVSGCDRENDAEGFEVDLDISLVSERPDGKITCIKPGGSGQMAAVDDIGTHS